MSYQRCYVKLADIAQLREDWDDAGASPFQQALILEAQSWLVLMERMGFPAPQQVVPAPDGCIVFAWQHEDGEIVEADIEPGSMTWALPQKYRNDAT